MKKGFYKISLILIIACIHLQPAFAQCSICTKTAQQLGEGPAKALNTGILYLMVIPFALIFFIGYRWYRRERELRK